MAEKNISFNNLHKMSDGVLMTFNTSGYDSSIDFVKGICILLVVWTHCFGDKIINWTFFDLWGYPAVPIFLLIQIFHAYKKGLDCVKKVSVKKLWDRIIKPFAILMATILAIKLAFSSESSINILKTAVKQGGFGPGSYYPYIYVQFAVILPLLAMFIKKIENKVVLAVIFIGISILFETVCSVVDIPVWIYRLLCFRYIFLVFFGVLLIENKLKINTLTVVLSLISAVAILYVRFQGHQFNSLPDNFKNILVPIFNVDLQPYFFHAWPQAHWVDYFWDCYLYLFVLLVFYKFVVKNEIISNFVQQIGKYSYEIFLFQMFYFTFSNKFFDVLKMLFDSKLLTRGIYVVVSTIVCIGVVLFWKKYITPKVTNVVKTN